MTFSTDNSDAYEKIKDHGGVGIYWSWDEGTAEAHGGFGVNGSYPYTFFGKVRVEDINWRSTMFKSAYDLKDEQEIEILKNGISANQLILIL